MNYKLIAYTEDFISFLIQNLDKEADKLKQIILFGSTARGEADKDSDIDLFIDITNKRIEKRINEINEKFYDSIKTKKYWNLLGVKNKINCTIGKLEEWEDLKRSLIANGTVLFGKYKETLETEPYYLFKVTPGKNRNRNISIWRKLYGYTQKMGKKKYIKEGLIKEYMGERLTRGVFIIPAEHSNKMISFLRKNKLKHSIMPFWQEKKIG